MGAYEVVSAVNALAREFHREQGCDAIENYRFDRSQNPDERLVWRLAALAYEVLVGIDVERALSEVHSDEKQECELYNEWES